MNTLNISNKDGFRFDEKAYLIGNEYGLLCVSYANDEQQALDNAVNDGFLDCQLMSDADHCEYDKAGWHDSFLYAGNASEPFWCDYLWIKPASERK